MSDRRYLLIKERLCKLTRDEVQRILDNAELLCTDTFNFDSTKQTYCPLALGMNLHVTVQSPTDASIKAQIAKRFFPVNIIKGVEGNFYTENRKSDIINVCKEILNNELYSS